MIKKVESYKLTCDCCGAEEWVDEDDDTPGHWYVVEAEVKDQAGHTTTTTKFYCGVGCVQDRLENIIVDCTPWENVQLKIRQQPLTFSELGFLCKDNQE